MCDSQHNNTQRNGLDCVKCHDPECRIFNVILSDVMLTVVIQNFVTLRVIMQRLFMVNVVILSVAGSIFSKQK